MGPPSFQLARYPGNGSRYARHADASPSSPARSITAIYYLNPGRAGIHPCCGYMRLADDVCGVLYAPQMVLFCGVCFAIMYNGLLSLCTLSILTQDCFGTLFYCNPKTLPAVSRHFVLQCIECSWIFPDKSIAVSYSGRAILFETCLPPSIATCSSVTHCYSALHCACAVCQLQLVSIPAHAWQTYYHCK